MDIGRLRSGEKIAGGSAILLFAFMFFRWYGLEITKRPNLLFDLHLREDGGNAWQTLEVTPIFLALVIVITVGWTLRRLISRDWQPSVSPGAAVCVLGALAVCLILMRIVVPPDLGGNVEGFTFDTTLKTGIFLALAAACGIAYGGRRAMHEEDVFFADLVPLRGKRQLRTRNSQASKG